MTATLRRGRGIRPAFALALWLALLAGCKQTTLPPAESIQVASPATSPSNNAILISWDGADRAVVKELLDAGRLPNLAAVIKAGSFRNIDVLGHDTETLPSHAEMLTGLSAENTGVFSNFRATPVPEGYSIFERLKKELGEDRIATIMVTGKRKIPALFPHARPAIDAIDSGDRYAPAVGTRALAALERYKKARFFAFIHFLDPDAAGHGYTSSGEPYREALRTCDAWLGAVLQWLRKAGLDGRTLIYVMTDHGFDTYGPTHSNAPDGWLATNDKSVIRGGVIGDVPLTILLQFGIDIQKLDPRPSGEPLNATLPPVSPTGN